MPAWRKIMNNGKRNQPLEIKVEDDVFKNNIGYTNRFENFTYRLKPVFRIRAKKRDLKE